MDSNYEVRWDRIGKTPTDLEQKEILEHAVNERIREDANDHELY